MKKKNRNMLYAVVLVAVIGGGLFMFYGEEMVGYASGLFDFENEDGIAGQCFVEATMGAYDVDGNVITTKTLQSGFMIAGVEVANIQFDISLTISGSNVDWNTLNPRVANLVIYPNGGEPINTGDALLTGDEMTVLSEDQRTADAKFTLWDADYAMAPTHDLAGALGDPVKSLDDGTDIFLLQMVFELEMEVMDLKGNLISSGVDVVGTWELNTLPDGTMDIVINDGVGAIDDGDLDPIVIDKIEPIMDITTETDKVVDNEPAPDVLVIPKDSELVN